jgi:osmotically-inducible protein OsmY
MQIKKACILVMSVIAFQSAALWATEENSLVNGQFFAANQQGGTETKDMQKGSTTGKSEVTPEDQSNKASDIDITKKIRRAIMDTEGMSMNAQNVKIITNMGKVTLRGWVDSENEKSAINRFATQVAGKENVINELQVKKQ